MPTAASAGRLSGMTIFHQIWKWFAPSIFAASSSSSGIVRMYWRSRKMLNMLTQPGTIRPR